MTDTLEDTLAHFGVKGMRWGRRKVGNFKSETRSEKSAEKADLKKDKKFLKENSGVKGFVNHQNAVAAKMNPKLDALNSKPEYKGINFSLNKAKQQLYLKDYESTLDEALNEVSSEIGLSPSGTRSVTLKRIGSGYDSYFEARYDRVRHADSDDTFLIMPKFNKLGHIIGQEIKAMESETVHSEDLEVGEFLEHFGVKGMKWGRRKASSDDGGGGGISRQENRALNKASRAADKAKAQEEILSARKRVYSKENQQQLKAAKEQYKKDKMEVGSREAKKALNEVKNKNWDDYVKSQQYLNGREAAQDVIATLAGTVLPGRLGEIPAGLLRERTIRRSVRGS